MKTSILIISLCLTFIAQASLLKSKKLKDSACYEIRKELHFISKKECSLSNFQITSGEDIKFKGQKYKILMNLEISLKGSLFFVDLNRDVSTSKGEIILGKWSTELQKYIIGDYHCIVMAHNESSNVVKMDKIETLPKSVLNWEGFASSEYAAKDDYLFYKIFNSNKHVGYLAYVWYENKEADTKGYDGQNFDLSGKLIGDEWGESFGYYE
jgi:hypothetical protein